MIQRILSLTGGVLAVAATACSPVEPRSEQNLDDKELGVIVFYADPVRINVPDTVRVGVPFEVSVRTYGNSCVAKDRTEVRTEGGRVQVRPYDLNATKTGCMDILMQFEHTAAVTFNQAGVREIEFRGRSLPADTAVTIVRSVVVR